MAIMNLFMYHYYNETCDKYAKNTIYIKQNIPSLSVFNFDISNEVKNELYQIGSIVKIF